MRLGEDIDAGSKKKILSFTSEPSNLTFANRAIANQRLVIKDSKTRKAAIGIAMLVAFLNISFNLI